MADLWKNGDVITADRLNKFIIANIIEENGALRLDITPEDIFDENNNFNGFMIIRQAFDYTQNNGIVGYGYLFTVASGYDPTQDVYQIIVSNLRSVNPLEFNAVKGEYFEQTDDGGGGSITK